MAKMTVNMINKQLYMADISETLVGALYKVLSVSTSHRGHIKYYQGNVARMSTLLQLLKTTISNMCYISSVSNAR